MANCACEARSIDYTAPGGTLATAPVTIACAMHGPERRAERRKHAEGVAACWRKLLRPFSQLQLTGPGVS